jgi:hypothetical protein
MAAEKKVDNATIATNATTPATITIPTSVFIAGSCTYGRKVKFNDTYTADGKLHQSPQQVEGDCSFELKGCHLKLNTHPGLAETITLKEGSNTFATLSGMITATWSESKNTTKIDVKASPSIDTKP